MVNPNDCLIEQLSSLIMCSKKKRKKKEQCSLALPLLPPPPQTLHTQPDQFLLLFFCFSPLLKLNMSTTFPQGTANTIVHPALAHKHNATSHLPRYNLFLCHYSFSSTVDQLLHLFQKPESICLLDLIISPDDTGTVS